MAIVQEVVQLRTVHSGVNAMTAGARLHPHTDVAIHQTPQLFFKVYVYVLSHVFVRVFNIF